MTHAVFFSPVAERDLVDVYAFYADEESSELAEELLRKLEGTCTSLETFPEKGNYPPELERVGVFNYRQVHCMAYRIIYQVFPDEVIIHCILDGRRDMVDLLTRRLLREP